MKSKLINFGNKFFVSSYKFAGFLVLTAILFGIVSYLTLSIFYLLDDDWVSPVILSPSSERVLELNTQLIRQKYQRENLVVEKMNLVNQLGEIERRIEMNERFQSRFKQAINLEIGVKRKQLNVYHHLIADYMNTKKEVASINEDFANIAKRSVDADYAAGLLNREGFVRNKFAVTQNLTNWFSYKQKEMELKSQADSLQRQVAALSQIPSNNSQATDFQTKSASQVYEVLMMERDAQQVLLENEQLKSHKKPIETQITAIDQAIKDNDAILTRIAKSPYYKALREKVTVAFVPYDNLDSAKPGTILYGCFLELVFCKPVGRVVSVLEGEISAKHPMFSSDIRGVMVHIDLEEPSWGEEKTLYAGEKPLLI